jgi:hypothetical protein
MDIQAEIESIKKELDKVEDKHLLQAIKNLLTYANKRDEIVGYDVRDGTLLTQEKLVERVREAEKEVEKGNYITHEELKEKMKKW